MVGSTLGESIVPVLMGWAMAFCGPWAMPLTTFGGALILLAIYLYVHFHSSSQMVEEVTAKEGSVSAGEWGSRSQHALLSEQVNPVHDSNGDDDDDDETKDIEMVPIQVVEPQRE